MRNLDDTLRELPTHGLPLEHSRAQLRRAQQRLQTERTPSLWERNEPTLLSALAAVQLLWVVARWLHS